MDQENPDIIQGGTYVTVNATLGNTPAFARDESKWRELLSQIGKRYKI